MTTSSSLSWSNLLLFSMRKGFLTSCTCNSIYIELLVPFVVLVQAVEKGETISKDSSFSYNLLFLI